MVGCLAIALSKRCFAGVGNLDPLRVRRCLGIIVVTPVPPLVWRGLGVPLRRIFPRLLTTERCDIEVAPSGPHRFVAAIVDEIGAEYAVAVAKEHIVAVPFVHTEIRVEAVGYRVPWHLPA